MPNSSTRKVVTITATSRADLDRQLDQAVDSFLAVASGRECGILVTRHSADKFSVELSLSVPVGLIRELDEWAL